MSKCLDNWGLVHSRFLVIMTSRRALLMSLNSFSNFAIFTASVIFEPRKSKMMFCDCRRAVLKARFMVLALLPTGHFISHSKSFIRISGVLAPFCCNGGKSSISKPCSVKKTTVAFSCVCKTTPLGVILPCFIKRIIPEP